MKDKYEAVNEFLENAREERYERFVEWWNTNVGSDDDGEEAGNQDLEICFDDMSTDDED